VEITFDELHKHKEKAVGLIKTGRSKIFCYVLLKIDDTIFNTFMLNLLKVSVHTVSVVFSIFKLLVKNDTE
jgi:hypothetical protein